MFAKVQLVKFNRKNAEDFMATLQEIRSNNHSAVLLKADGIRSRVKIIAVNRQLKEFSFSFAEADYPQIIRWCQSTSKLTEQGHLLFTVTVQEEGFCIVDRFWVQYGKVKLVGSREVYGKETVRQLEVAFD